MINEQLSKTELTAWTFYFINSISNCNNEGEGGGIGGDSIFSQRKTLTTFPLDLIPDASDPSFPSPVQWNLGKIFEITAGINTPTGFSSHGVKKFEILSQEKGGDWG